MSDWTVEIDSMTVEGVSIGDRVAFTWYTASGRYTGEGGVEVRFDHKYLDTLVKSESGWRIAAHTVSTNDESESLWAAWRPGGGAGLQ